MSTAVRRVLVAVASRHGGTAGIAADLAAALGGAPGVSAVVVPVAQQPDPASFDAVVLGSAIYAGRWLEPAREYAATHAAQLRLRPVWLFSSGPIGEPPYPPDEPHDVAPLTALTGARGHRTFPGRLDPTRLSFGERAMATAMRAPVGDFRDPAAARAWAAALAVEIGAASPVA
ncbi:flavodoxin domain-containing protein [Blastococcus jejuensis]|uniref:Flavodoxin domain-containing protein n=1 Tax=Blastococcus jejuensis TaxID=351224 RepID=A0ABP6NYP4_9ACTN